MSALALLSIAIGAVLGAWCRYGLGLWLNPLVVTLPFLGTLVANLLGGYLIGVAMMAFHLNPHLPPETKLFFITGFLGALTTFSTFSAEVVYLIQHTRYAWAAGIASAHLFGSLVMTGLGLATVHWLASSKT